MTQRRRLDLIVAARKRFQWELLGLWGCALGGWLILVRGFIVIEFNFSLTFRRLQCFCIVHWQTLTKFNHTYNMKNGPQKEGRKVAEIQKAIINLNDLILHAMVVRRNTTFTRSHSSFVITKCIVQGASFSQFIAEFYQAHQEADSKLFTWHEYIGTFMLTASCTISKNKWLHTEKTQSHEPEF